MPIISAQAIEKRKYWIEEIEKLSGSFGDDSDRVEGELAEEIARDGLDALLNHLRLCGDIPESYSHDSSEEKLYSKYTDALLNEAYKKIGLASIVLKERGDAADVEAYAPNYSFVADAKAFRLSRTAKNQKDFKVQAMHGWKRGKPYAMVVCPIYQLPTRASQIYQQAISREVCIFTYSHLSVLSSYAQYAGAEKAQNLLLNIFQSFPALNPTKDAHQYWMSLNKSMLSFDGILSDFWRLEKMVAVESISIAKEIALSYLASERERIMRMTHQEALNELVRKNNIDSRIATIKAVTDTGLMNIV